MTVQMHDCAPANIEARVPTTLIGRLVARPELSNGDTEAMYELLSHHFIGVDRATFGRDLEEKNWVILLQNEDGVLRGFSTVLIYATSVCGRPMTVVCSGDTIVDPSAWGTPALPRAWIRAIYDLSNSYPPGDLFWLLLTSGFRTYRFMSVFCREFYPRFDATTPPDRRAILDALSRERFGAAYDADAGLVRFPKPQKLSESLRGVPDGRSADPHIRFFLDRNPGHTDGDELVSLSSLAMSNLTAAGRRMAR